MQLAAESDRLLYHRPMAAIAKDMQLRIAKMLMEVPRSQRIDNAVVAAVHDQRLDVDPLQVGDMQRFGIAPELSRCR